MRLFLGIVLALVPALSWGGPPLSVEVSPAWLVLGTGKTAKIHLELPVLPGQKIRTAASVGEIHALSASDPNGQDFLFVPPSSRFPITAVLIFWVESPAPDRFTVVRLPLWGRTTLQIATDPFAKVQVRVGDRLFGPAQADGDGSVSVPVEVPPGTRSAVAIAEVGGQKTERNVPLPAPPAMSLTSALSPTSLRPKEKALWAIAHSAPLTGRVLKVSAQGATATLIDRDKDRAIYLVKPDDRTDRVQLSAEVLGEEGLGTSLSAEVGDPKVPISSDWYSPPRIGNFLPFFQVGLYFGGEANLGPSIHAGVSVPLPVLTGRLAAELEAGLQTSSFGSAIPGLGDLNSRLWSIPVTLGARYRAWETARGGLDVRAGLGTTLFHHVTWSSFASSDSENGLAPNGFLAASGFFRLQTWEPFAELRGAISPVNTPHLHAQSDGLSLSVGGRFHGP